MKPFENMPGYVHADGATLAVQPLPAATFLNVVVKKTFGVQVARGDAANPLGERGDAAQLAGILKACVEMVESGLRGGQLQTQFQKGYLNTYSRNSAQVWGSLSDRMADGSQLALEGMRKVTPHAAKQLCLAALAMLVANHALDAAAQIALGAADADGERIQSSSLTALACAEFLNQYAAECAEQWQDDDDRAGQGDPS